jgi:uncharacterized membrane protein YphA (DoxX/SURF4 family)
MFLRVLLLIFRVLFGLVFIFSGFVKAIDPLGFAYKIEDYLMVVPFLQSLVSLSLAAAILISAIEFLIGVSIVFGVRLKEVSFVGLLFMLVMTPLTLWIALKNPVTDCGCFGEALIISNWATFWKNVVLLVLIIGIILLQKNYHSLLRPLSQSMLVAYAFLFSICISVYCYLYLPLIDFRPYKIGANIIEGMTIPPDAPQDEYETTFIYAKNGEEKEFTLENYPKNDSTWVFVDQKSVLIKKGYVPSIHDFTIDLPIVGDITEDVLHDTRYTFLLISYDLGKANLASVATLNRLYEYCKQHNYPFYCLTSSTQDDIDRFKEKSQAAYPIALTDKITLKTIIRANPGVLLIKDAVVLNKWHSRNIPVFDKPLTEDSRGTIKNVNILLRLLVVGLIFIIPIILLYGFDKQMKPVKRD